MISHEIINEKLLKNTKKLVTKLFDKDGDAKKFIKVRRRHRMIFYRRRPNNCNKALAKTI